MDSLYEVSNKTHEVSNLEITAKSFSGRYGTKKNVGDIIHVSLNISNIVSNNNNKEIIFLIDISGSMSSSMKAVISSMLAFRDAILQKTPQEMEALTKEERDNLIRQINMRVITFSNSAKEVWSFQSPYNYEETIKGLSCEALTNMGDALKLAFSKISPQKFTWIVAMTDGLSNSGPCRTASSFQKLVTCHKPLHTKIISLGYGTEFDPETLNQIGSFVHVEDSEMIPVVLANIAEEFALSVSFNCVVDVPDREINEFDEETIIVPDGESKTVGKVIVGDRVLGSLISGKEYNYVYLPHGNNLSDIQKYNTVVVRYTDIESLETVIRSVKIEHTQSEPTPDLVKMYFQSESKRLIYSLYRAIQKGNIKKEIPRVQKILEGWSPTEVNEEKEAVLKLIEDILKKDEKKVASMALNQAVGNNYSTPSFHGYSLATMISADYYMTSPTINDQLN